MSQIIPAEQIFYRDQGVLVSNARFVVPGQTFAMANITSVQMQKLRRDWAWPVSGIVLGAILALIGRLYVGAAFIAASVALLMWLKPTYFVVLRTAGAETEALRSENLGRVQTIVAALNQAMISRG